MFTPLTDNTRLEQYLLAITMNSKNMANLNPLVKKRLDSTVPGPYARVVLGLLDEMGTEAGLIGADKNAEGALRLIPSESGDAARCSLTLLVTKYPSLRVEQGRVRVFPVRMREENGTKVLVLDLVNTTVEVPEVLRKRKRAQARAAKSQGGTQAEPAKEAESARESTPPTIKAAE